MTSLKKIEGVGEKFADKLRMYGITTIESLLEKGATPKGRQEIAEKTGIAEKLVLEWVNLGDLFRVRGIGEEYSDLLEEAGVDTVVELSKRNADNLYEKLLEVNTAKKLVRRLPSKSLVEGWIEQAKKLGRVVSY